MIRLENVSKVYKLKDKEIKAVDDVTLNINEGDIYGIIGTSGAGKSTIVRCMNLLEKPTEGKVYLGDTELTSVNIKELRNQRKKIGMIFQQFNLLDQRTALGNVCYPLEIIGVPKSAARKKATELLELVGLDDRMHNYPSQLSGGQKQRVAIARALATDPEVILCDEATSALDPNTTKSILELLQKINAELKLTIVIITHELNVIEKICNRVAVVENGKVEEEDYTTNVLYSPKSEVTKKLLSHKENLTDGDINIKLPKDEQKKAELLKYLETKGILYKGGNE